MVLLYSSIKYTCLYSIESTTVYVLLLYCAHCLLNIHETACSLVTTTRSSFSEFAQRNARDERFKAVEKMREREQLFSDYLQELKKTASTSKHKAEKTTESGSTHSSITTKADKVYTILYISPPYKILHLFYDSSLTLCIPVCFTILCCVYVVCVCAECIEILPCVCCAVHVII